VQVLSSVWLGCGYDCLYYILCGVVCCFCFVSFSVKHGSVVLDAVEDAAVLNYQIDWCSSVYCSAKLVAWCMTWAMSGIYLHVCYFVCSHTHRTTGWGKIKYPNTKIAISQKCMNIFAANFAHLFGTILCTNAISYEDKVRIDWRCGNLVLDTKELLQNFQKRVGSFAWWKQSVNGLMSVGQQRNESHAGNGRPKTARTEENARYLDLLISKNRTLNFMLRHFAKY